VDSRGAIGLEEPIALFFLMGCEWGEYYNFLGILMVHHLIHQNRNSILNLRRSMSMLSLGFCQKYLGGIEISLKFFSEMIRKNPR
jgi:hypothetical protein